MAQPLEGLKELQSTLARIIAAPSPKRLERALIAGGEVVAAEAKRLVPVLSGNLRESIIVSTRGLGGAFKMNMGVGGGATVYVGPKSSGGNPDGWYGHMIEFGTIHLAAQPFMRPAFDNTKSEVSTVIARTIWGDIRAAARG